jgi:hypothetical protein
MKGHRMSVLSRLRPALLLAALAAGAPAAFGADPAAAPGTPVKNATAAAPSGFSDRLFFAFAQDAVMVKSQWWEAQVEFADGSKGVPVDVWLMRGVVAFRPVKNLEVGGSFGLGTTSASNPLYEGTGATDLEAYGKWVFPDAAAHTDFTAGLLFTIPTGDDTAGLGFNAFSSQAFGAVRYRLDSVVLGGHVGLCLNGDGAFQGQDLNGKASFEMGFSALFPLANQVSLVGEAQVATARFDNPSPNSAVGAEAATQILGGINWRAFGRGMFRGAVAFGLTEGAPDFSVLASYAYTF